MVSLEGLRESDHRRGLVVGGKIGRTYASLVPLLGLRYLNIRSSVRRTPYAAYALEAASAAAQRGPGKEQAATRRVNAPLWGFNGCLGLFGTTGTSVSGEIGPLFGKALLEFTPSTPAGNGMGTDNDRCHQCGDNCQRLLRLCRARRRPSRPPRAGRRALYVSPRMFRINVHTRDTRTTHGYETEDAYEIELFALCLAARRVELQVSDVITALVTRVVSGSRPAPGQGGGLNSKTFDETKRSLNRREHTIITNAKRAERSPRIGGARAAPNERGRNVRGSQFCEVVLLIKKWVHFASEEVAAEFQFKKKWRKKLLDKRKRECVRTRKLCACDFAMVLIHSRFHLPTTNGSRATTARRALEAAPWRIISNALCFFVSDLVSVTMLILYYIVGLLNGYFRSSRLPAGAETRA
ncbi:hypothetical protein EVAR_39948_1 [Eumeta japonica]|uniref:Uncharacterized protein n=1 Tax=Eumeta variegata TaxID=151549 RepID=A0A4C1X4K6_EUMVA|nr:hypothetical protein EVAR_39948_1 [Eumeta japonica]